MTLQLRRRSLLAGGAALALTPWARLAQAQDKPAELIVRAWGGVWVEALDKGVSQPFTAMTGIAVRHDLTEDNEIRPKIWAAVDQGRPPPIHINWDTSTNATKSALRGVTEDLGDLPNLKEMLPAAAPAGFDGVPLINMYSYVYVLAYRDEAFPGGAPDSWQILLDPKFKGRVALYDDGIGFHPSAQMAGGGKFEDIPDNMAAAWDFITKLKAQAPLLGEDPDFTTWFQNGEIDVACTILSNARAAKQSGIAVSWTVPKEGAKVDTDGMWIPKGLPANELHWAREYVNFAMSQAAQQEWTSLLGLPGLRALDALERLRASTWPRALDPLAPWAFLVPALLLTGLLVAGLVPLADASLRALDRGTFRLSEAWTLANYASLIERPVYAVMALRTLLGAAIVTAITLALAFPYAWLMVRTPSAWLRKVLLVSLFLPFFIGQVVRAYGWLVILGQQGLANSLLAGLGLPPQGILYTFPGVLLGLVQYMLPFAVLMLAPAVTAVPEEVELASAGLGATPARTLTRIVLPLARPGLVAAGVVVFTLTLTDFAIPEIMGGGGNDFIASAVYDAFFQLGDPGLGGAIGIMLTLTGSLAVGLILALFGLGTLGYIEARR